METGDVWAIDLFVGVPASRGIHLNGNRGHLNTAGSASSRVPASRGIHLNGNIMNVGCASGFIHVPASRGIHLNGNLQRNLPGVDGHMKLSPLVGEFT